MRGRGTVRAWPGLLGLVLLACGGGEPAAPVAIRLIEPPPGSRSTAAFPRARVGDESRTVLASHPRVAIVEQRPVVLPAHGDLRVTVELPEGPPGDVVIDARVRVAEPAADAADEALLPRRTLSVPPLLVRANAGSNDAHAVTIAFPLPDEVRGRNGALRVIGHALPAAPSVRVETAPVEVPPDARLVFGYAVEEPCWSSGWPPVRFRVRATDEAATVVPLFDRRIDPAGDPRDRRWFDASVSLAALAGQRVRFAFEAEALVETPGAKLTRSLAVISNPEIVAAVPRSASGVTRHERKPSLVLISIDALRARSVSAYGHARLTTPSLDRRLAAGGTLVRLAVTPFPITGPSHMTMLTGLEPCAHGIGLSQEALAPERTTLAEALRAAAYRTGAFTENGYLVGEHGFARGFDLYVENREPESDTAGFARETFRAAAEWLARPSHRPSFAFIHTYQVHAPYAAPRGYRSLFFSDGETDPWRLEEAEYEREIRYTDDILADFLDRLDALGLAEDTIVALTSDHGEAFGEHGAGRHGNDLHDESLLVPLVVWGPGRVLAGRAIEEQVGLVDLAPTLLELLEVAPLQEAQGRSFAGLLNGSAGRFEERPVVSGDLRRGTSVRTRRYKYIRHARELLYDLSADPGETENIAASRPALLEEARAVAQRARERCKGWRRAHPETPQFARRLEPARAQEVLEKLRSLGYIE